jgi:predicted NUDIX family NTP pyrophosphohydrolase
MVQTAGILLFKADSAGYQVLLVHPGGPLWGHKDIWELPKGLVDAGEDVQAAAYREFEEEVGMTPPPGPLIDLGSIKSGNKLNFIWALEGDVNLQQFHSNLFTMEWPPHSGVVAEFPETDRAAWFDFATAKQKLFKSQVGFIDRLAAHLAV